MNKVKPELSQIPMTDTTLDSHYGSSPTSPPWAKSTAKTRPRRAFWSLVFGVALPLVVLVLELITGFCASVFFDPIPTLWHILLVASVPIVTHCARRALIEGRVARPIAVAMAMGFAFSVSGYYLILYVPLMPASTMALIVFGMGLLSLSPCLNFAALSSLAWRLWEEKILDGRAARAMVGGVLLGLLALLALDGRNYIARYAMAKATSGGAESREFGLALLRNAGSKKTVLRACYEPGGTWNGGDDPAGWMMGFVVGDVSNKEARDLYYRMTGEPFTNEEAPRIRTTLADDGRSRRGRRLMADADQGGAEVGGWVPGLSLDSSRIDSHIDPVSSIAYTEWALVFDNASRANAEARFSVDLPPAGVVSRLTLWINGEPHEAAFGSKSQTRGAYEKVVRRNRDPVLITQSTPGRVLVQCFPVLPNDQMKIRFGITAPLDPLGRSWLPAIVDENFEIERGFEHALWAQCASSEITTGFTVLDKATPRGGGHALEGTTSGEKLAGGNAWFSAGATDPTATVHALDKLGDPENPRRLVRRGSSRESAVPEQVVVVIDTSIGMRDRWGEVEDSISLLASNCQTTLVLAGDNTSTSAGASAIAEALADTRPAGGIDNSPALLHALELAGQDPSVPILWLHAAQPALLTSKQHIEQTLERRLARHPIYSLQLGRGADVVSEAFSALADLRPAPRGETLEESIALLFGDGPRVAFEYDILAPGQNAPDGSVEVWDHLVRHWAFDQVRTELQSSDRPEASVATTAARYQLVTPLSGAVVLERKEQFDAAGLKQLKASETPSVPTIPEPSSALLALFGCIALALRRRR